MKTKLIALVSLLFVCTMAGYAKKVTGNGQVVSREISISDYTEIYLGENIYPDNQNTFTRKSNNNSLFFNCSQNLGNKACLAISTDENIVSLLEIKVNNHKLSIQSKEGYQVYPTKFVIHSNSTTLEKVEVYSSIDLNIPDGITSETLSLHVSGSGDVSIERFAHISTSCEFSIIGSGDLQVKRLACPKMKATILGSGDMNINGEVRNGELYAYGSGDINAYELIVDDLICKVGGSGDIYASGKSTLDAYLLGSGDIKYKGDPQTKLTKKGSGDLERVK